MSLSHTLFVMTAISSVRELCVTSPAFNNMGEIPQKYTADGANINPPLILGKIPRGTHSLVILVEDLKAPVDTWVHWLVWDIPPTTKIKEDVVPGTEGVNSFLVHHYKGPCPLANARNYSFKVYALKKMLNINCHSTKYEVMRAMKGHVLGYGELIGTYSHNNVVGAVTNIAPDIYS